MERINYNYEDAEQILCKISIVTSFGLSLCLSLCDSFRRVEEHQWAGHVAFFGYQVP